MQEFQCWNSIYKHLDFFSKMAYNKAPGHVINKVKMNVYKSDARRIKLVWIKWVIIEFYVN